MPAYKLRIALHAAVDREDRLHALSLRELNGPRGERLRSLVMRCVYRQAAIASEKSLRPSPWLWMRMQCGI